MGKTKIPIAKDDEGKICLLNIQKCQEKNFYIRAGETWQCEVEKNYENKCFVIPIAKIFTKEENDYFMEEKIKLLKLKHNESI